MERRIGRAAGPLGKNCSLWWVTPAWICINWVHSLGTLSQFLILFQDCQEHKNPWWLINQLTNGTNIYGFDVRLISVLDDCSWIVQKRIPSRTLIFLQTSYSSIFYYILEYIAGMIILLNFLSYIQIMNSLLTKVQNVNKMIRYSCSHELLPRDCS